MRVISGIARGKKLKAPNRARPLTDRAKEALFNILMSRVADSSFLDLFAGSGAVAIEALSRGAERAVLVEMDRSAVKVIRENLDFTGLAGRATIFPIPVDRALKILAKKEEKFDLIFLGAPYDSPALDSALGMLGQNGLLASSGLLIAEHRKQDQILPVYGRLKSIREERYGETVFTFYENSDLPG